MEKKSIFLSQFVTLQKSPDQKFALPRSQSQRLKSRHQNNENAANKSQSNYAYDDVTVTKQLKEKSSYYYIKHTMYNKPNQKTSANQLLQQVLINNQQQLQKFSLHKAKIEKQAKLVSAAYHNSFDAIERERVHSANKYRQDIEYYKQSNSNQLKNHNTYSDRIQQQIENLNNVPDIHLSNKQYKQILKPDYSLLYNQKKALKNLGKKEYSDFKNERQQINFSDMLTKKSGKLLNNLYYSMGQDGDYKQQLKEQILKQKKVEQKKLQKFGLNIEIDEKTLNFV